MPKTNRYIFLVEDDASVRRALKRLVRSFGYEVDAFASARDVFNTLSTAVPDCLIVDVQMPGLNGLGLQHHLAEAGHKLPIIFITAHEDAQVYQHAMQAGAVAFLYKPFSDEVLLEAIHAATGEPATRPKQQPTHARGRPGT